MAHRDDLADRDLLIAAARAAGPIAMAAFRPGAKAQVSKREKDGGKGPVSEIDLAVNAALADRLRAARPDYGWLSEEDEDDGARLSARRAFSVDPIDGTRSFLDGVDDFCISVAVVADGAPVAAAIFAPARDAVWSAALGAGAERDGARLAVSERARLDGARVLARRSVSEAKAWRGPAPAIERGYRHPIAYRLALVAEGSWDAIISISRTNEWDVAAGALLMAEAGARVSEKSGDPVRFNKPTPRVDGMVGAAPSLHAAIVGGLAS